VAHRDSGLSIYPAHDLPSDARAAVQGASYHLASIERLVAAWQSDSRAADASTIHWELRAFFWELVAALDTVETHLKRLPKHSETRSLGLASLKGVKAEDWYQELEEWRDFSHRAFIFVQAEVHANGRLHFLFLPRILPSQVQHRVPERLRDYLEHVHTTAEGLLAIGVEAD